MGHAMKAQALVWYRQGRLGDAKSETLRALEVYEKVGAAEDAEGCRKFLRKVERAMENQPSPADPDLSGELLGTTPSCTYSLTPLTGAAP